MTSKKQIVKFLEELKNKDKEKYEVLVRLRNIILEELPETTETFKYGGIMFSLNDNFGGLFVSKNHISFEFTYGYKLNCDLKLLGSGKYRRHLKIRELDVTLKENIKVLLNQIKSID